MNKKILTIGGIIVLIAVAIVFFSTNKNTQPSEPTPSASSTVPVGLYTLADVAQHATQPDCWMAIEGKVYNVTSYVDKHPGGKAILLGCGKDATILFNTRPDGPGTPHPAEARQILQQFYVGDLKT